VLFFTAQEHLTFSIIPAEKKDARAYAVDEDGTLLWNTAIMPPAVKDALNRGDRAAGREEVEKPHRIFGLTYHPAVDAYIAADFSGDIFAFDRCCKTFGFEHLQIFVEFLVLTHAHRRNFTWSTLTQ
jgi:hypothetical protein